MDVEGREYMMMNSISISFIRVVCMTSSLKDHLSMAQFTDTMRPQVAVSPAKPTGRTP